MSETGQLEFDLGATEIQVKLLEKLQEVLDSQLPLGDRLWSYKEVAVYFDCSPLTARRIMGHAGAPRPVRLPSSGENFLPDRFFPDEVKAYAKRRVAKQVSVT